MAVSNGDILRMALRFTNADSGDIVNIWHFQVVERGTEEIYAWLTSLVYNVMNKYSAELMPRVSSDVEVADVKFDRVSWVDGKEVVLESFGIIDVAGYIGGSAVGDTLPQGVAPLVKWRTQGVKTLAKKYLPVLTETDTSAGHIGSTTLADIADFAAHFLSDIVFTGGVTGTIRAVVHSKRDNAWVRFLSAAANSIFAYQRRRKQGVGS